MFDRATFRGREEIVRDVELVVADDHRGATLSLIAPRRCGKASLLRMLPVKMPDTLCVFFDLQDNPVSEPLDLFPAIEKRMLEQADFEERQALPRLKERSLEAVSDWLQALEDRPGSRRIRFFSTSLNGSKKSFVTTRTRYGN